MDHQFREIRKGERDQVLGFAKGLGCEIEPKALHHHLSLAMIRDGQQVAAALCVEAQPKQFLIEVINNEGVDQALIAELADRCLRKLLAAQGYAVQVTRSGDEAMERLEQLQAKATSQAIGLALIDQDAAGLGMEKLRHLHDDWPMIVPIVTSAFRKVESAVAAMRLGAADYLLKPIVEGELFDAVQRAMQRHLLMVERELAQQEVGKPAATEAHDTQGGSPYAGGPLSEAMRAPERLILLAALEANGWNRGETAKQLDINRTTLYKKIRQHRLDEPA
eukprot:g12513.t1